MKTGDQTRPRSRKETSHLFLVGRAAGWKRWTSKSTALRRCVLQSDDEIRRCFVESPKDSVWVTRRATRLATLAKDSLQGSGDRRLLVLGAMDEIRQQVLAAWFRYVVVETPGLSLLEPKELFEVLQAPNRNELFIGGAFEPEDKVVVLYRGTVQPLVVPLDWFRNTATRVQPNPGHLQVIDYGHTIKMGEFEAATDAILYEFDAGYRKLAKKRFIEADTSLGGAIRRLRLQRGLSRGEFPSVPVRTMARIERGEVTRPRRSTLERIAVRLGVPFDSLGSY